MTEEVVELKRQAEQFFKRPVKVTQVFYDNGGVFAQVKYISRNRVYISEIELQ